MAGAWEEVVSVGRGIRTGAGTGVELNKKGEDDGATENIGWADEAAKGKKLAAGPLLNKQTVYLADFWRNSDFEFSLKVTMPRMGPATAA
jgi:hypothetical protein